MRGRAWVVIAAGACSSAASTGYAADESCGKVDRPSTYRAMPGDVATTTRLEAVRALEGNGEIEINVCNGELRVERGPRADRELRLTVSSPGADANLSNYLQDLAITRDKAVVNVRVPGKFHPVVTIFVPSSAETRSEVNLGAGTLTFNAGTLAGNREINVGAGTARILIESERDYGALQTNIGMGKLEDSRPGGRNGYGIVSRSSAGKGSGTLEVNVGAGKVVLEQGAE